MIRDFRIENHLFWPHIRNGTYVAFFEQAVDMSVDPSDIASVAASMWAIERKAIDHPILDLE